MQVWRDAYSLATLLLVAARSGAAATEPESSQLISPAEQSTAAAASTGQQAKQQAGEQDQDAPQRADLDQHLRALDLAVLMGGPRYRSAVDTALQALQALPVQALQTADAGLAEDTGQRSAKRQRTAAAASQPASDADGDGQPTPRPNALAAKQVQLPLGSFGDRGSTIAVQSAPSLEAFLLQHLVPCVPTVLSGGSLAACMFGLMHAVQSLCTCLCAVLRLCGKGRSWQHVKPISAGQALLCCQCSLGQYAAFTMLSWSSLEWHAR